MGLGLGLGIGLGIGIGLGLELGLGWLLSLQTHSPQRGQSRLVPGGVVEARHALRTSTQVA